MLAGKRATRVGDLLWKQISILLLEEVRDPRVRDVSITGIQLTNDLKFAKVYFSVMGGASEVGRAQLGLDSARRFIKREIGMRMGLKYVPEIVFVHDPSLEKGRYMDSLFEGLQKAEEAGGD